MNQNFMEQSNCIGENKIIKTAKENRKRVGQDLLEAIIKGFLEGIQQYIASKTKIWIE